MTEAHEVGKAGAIGVPRVSSDEGSRRSSRWLPGYGPSGKPAGRRLLLVSRSGASAPESGDGQPAATGLRFGSDRRAGGCPHGHPQKAVGKDRPLVGRPGPTAGIPERVETSVKAPSGFPFTGNPGLAGDACLVTPGEWLQQGHDRIVLGARQETSHSFAIDDKGPHIECRVTVDDHLLAVGSS